MIPIRLKLSCFLSYYEPVSIDFEGVHLACISGRNGAGKSSILDGMTWALFGESRSKSNDDIINRMAQKKRKNAEAEVEFEFLLKHTLYRVIRRKQARKSMILEFYLKDSAGQWKTLTESRQQETQGKIQKALNMNFDTFVNASFFLQNKADEFTIKTANKRKEILADVLGVSRWDLYKEAVSTRYKESKLLFQSLAGRLSECQKRLEAFRSLEEEFQKIETQLSAQRLLKKEVEFTLRALQKTSPQQEREDLLHSLKKSETHLLKLQDLLKEQERKQSNLQQILQEEVQILHHYEEWKQLESELEILQEKQKNYYLLQEEKRPYERAYESKKAQLLQQKKDFEIRAEQTRKEGDQVQQCSQMVLEIEKELDEVRKAFEASNQEQDLLLEARSRLQSLDAHQQHFRQDEKKLQERLLKLQEEQGGFCPLCEQPLSAEHRQGMIEKLQQELIQSKQFLKTQQETFQGEYQNTLHFTSFSQAGTALEDKIKLSQKQRKLLESQQLKQQQKLVQQTQHLENLERRIQQWETEEQLKYERVLEQLEKDEIDPPAQKQLESFKIQESHLQFHPDALKSLHLQRKQKANAPEKYRQWNEAKQSLALLVLPYQQLQEQLQEAKKNKEQLQEQWLNSTPELSTTPQTGELLKKEKEYAQVQEEENQLQEYLGRLKQQQKDYENLQEEQKKYQQESHTLQLLMQRLEVLEKTCGRDGIQALLIEQALPEIEDHVNALLHRLTHGEMHIRFETQKTLKTREEQVETLEIQIVDNVGERPYENFSGGEQFRINFAIRLALSKVLTQRAGAKLQTLVIDEGFGSQDPEGIQRLIEVINVIQDEFACILIITHIDELRDVFPVRIEVEKGASGSTLNLC
jgi:exonuclease SbcC